MFNFPTVNFRDKLIYPAMKGKHEQEQVIYEETHLHPKHHHRHHIYHSRPCYTKGLKIMKDSNDVTKEAIFVIWWV